MDTDEMLKDEFLANLIKKVPLESPSDGFTDNVMAGIEPFPAVIAGKQPYLMWLRSSAAYIMLGLAVIGIIYSSDIPYLNFIYGKEYFTGIFQKIFEPFWLSMKTMVSSRFVIYLLLIGVSAGFLFIIDKLFSRRFAA